MVMNRERPRCPQGAWATRIVRRNETSHKELNPHGIAKSPISLSAPNEAYREAKRNRRLRFRFVWLRFVSPAPARLRRGRIRLESAIGFGA
jgi:hypothetical protein